MDKTTCIECGEQSDALKRHLTGFSEISVSFGASALVYDLALFHEQEVV
jgi:hypothetical protein